MQPVVTASEMLLIDRLTIEDAGIPGLVLMENAAREVTQAILDAYGNPAMVTVVAGTGNNGGDGVAVARQLHAMGVDTLIVLVGAREKVHGDALTQLDIADTLGIDVIEVYGESIPDEALEALSIAEVCVDALFGVGLSREITGVYAEILESLAEVDAPIVAIDIPSGVCADTGRVRGVAVAADLTVTLGALKRGLTQYPGRALAGEILLGPIGIPEAVFEHVAPSVFVSNDLQSPFLPPRPPQSHKGSYGHIVVFGGAPGRSGAPLLAALAAMRSGAGLCTIVTHEAVQPSLEGRYPELMFASGWNDTQVHEHVLQQCLIQADAIVVGPGLAAGAVEESVLNAVLRSDVPAVIDAGALRLLAPLDADDLLPGDRILTPHPGEAAHLLGWTTSEVQADRFQASAALTERVGGVVVLKGAATIVASEAAGAAVNTTGNPGMATAGAGDVLAGMCAAFSIRDADVFEAARLAVHVHGLAGDLAAQRLGSDALMAMDIVADISTALKGDGPD